MPVARPHLASDVDRALTRGERAVDAVERISCNGVCFGAEAVCFEPEGQDVINTWAYVGEGKGGYDKVHTFSYVGEGGQYDKAESETVTAWQVKPCWLVFGLAVIVAVVYGSVGASGLLAPASTLTTTQSTLFLYNCATGPPTAWDAPKKQYCCQTFGTGCDHPGPPPPPPPAPPAPPTTPQPATTVPTTAAPPPAVPAAVPPPTLVALTRPPALPVVTTPVVPPPPAPKFAPVEQPLYDCAAGFDKLDWGWSAGKKDWCCRHEGKGCPAGKAALPAPYTCFGDTRTWTPGQQAWCCSHEKLGCLEVALAPVSPSAFQAQQQAALVAAGLQQPAPR